WGLPKISDLTGKPRRSSRRRCASRRRSEAMERKKAEPEQPLESEWDTMPSSEQRQTLRGLLEAGDFDPLSDFLEDLGQHEWAEMCLRAEGNPLVLWEVEHLCLSEGILLYEEIEDHQDAIALHQSIRQRQG